MSGITVSGGAGGVGARLDDMRLQAQQLAALSTELIGRSGTAAAKAVDGDLLESMILSPLTGAAAEGAIVLASGSLLLVATETGVSAVFLEGAVVAYETADQLIAAATVALHNGVAFVIGVLAVPVGLVAAAGVAVVGGAWMLTVAGVNIVVEGVDSLVEGAQQTLDQIGDNPWLLLSPAGVAGLFTANSIAAYSPQEVIDRTAATYADALARLQELAPIAAQAANEWLGDNAWIEDILTDGAPGLLAGLTFLPGLLPGFNGLMSVVTGQGWPPLTYEQAIDAIATGGGRFGLFDDGQGGLAMDPDDPSQPLAVPRDRTVTDLGDLLQGSADIDKGEEELSNIRVIQSAGPPPSWIVQIPSTQVWDPHGGAISNDLTSDIAAMQGEQTALGQAVRDAMAAAGISPTDPVMLEGFSLGGITAGSLASDPDFGYNVTHVVTAGSPIARFDIPDDVQVLSMEFNEDPVARLDGQGNPDSANWTTVQGDAPRLGGVNPEQQDPGIASAHNAQRYEMMADQTSSSGDPSVDAYLDSASGFFSGDQQVTDYSPTRR
ncbi:hypothetical protein HOW07_05555 [Plantibacter sp. MCCC 1A11337]|uniref:hypothetical protein n=1 Tax=Plantibacter sp. MCCC 1A11337 TaxID=2736644 RepID=UPI001583A591|nr:hypothetical protein [Plantibacter sp. MCCC 1A11337]NUJ87470.1 hypothetical protein [Plantibacter sp. MCCC 1A11337]